MPKIVLQTHDKRSLGHILEDLGKVHNDLKSLIESMEGNEIESIDVRFSPEVERALENLPKFVGDGMAYVRKAVIQQGNRYRTGAVRKTPAEMDEEIGKAKKKPRKATS